MPSTGTRLSGSVARRSSAAPTRPATTPSRRRRKPRTALRTGRRIPRPAATREATSRPGLTRAARTDPDPPTDDPRAEPRRAGIVHVDARPSAEPQTGADRMTSPSPATRPRSEEHTPDLQPRGQPG